MTTERYHAIVKGRVQGVWFRAHTRDKALELGLTGWVRNLPDGSVETEFQGPAEQTARMREWLWIGSPHSMVTDVKTTPVSVIEGEGGFDIRY